MRDDWWRSGVAGAIPSAACFVLAGAFLFAAARRLYASAAAGLAVALLFALNPNMLYLQSTPMTEAMFAAALAALLWATVWFRDSQSVWAVLAAAAASNAASLTRYEGWFLIPFVALYLLIDRAPEIPRAGLCRPGRAGPAGVAGAQSVLLFERAGIL